MPAAHGFVSQYKVAFGAQGPLPKASQVVRKRDCLARVGDPRMDRLKGFRVHAEIVEAHHDPHARRTGGRRSTPINRG